MLRAWEVPARRRVHDSCGIEAESCDRLMRLPVISVPGGSERDLIEGFGLVRGRCGPIICQGVRAYSRPSSPGY